MSHQIPLVVASSACGLMSIVFGMLAINAPILQRNTYAIVAGFAFIASIILVALLIVMDAKRQEPPRQTNSRQDRQ